MGKVSWLDRWHALKHAGDERYRGMSFNDRLKAEYAYGISKRMFGVTDPEGHLIDPGTAYYKFQKEAMRNDALRIASGKKGIPMEMMEEGLG